MAKENLKVFNFTNDMAVSLSKEEAMKQKVSSPVPLISVKAVKDFEHQSGYSLIVCATLTNETNSPLKILFSNGRQEPELVRAHLLETSIGMESPAIPNVIPLVIANYFTMSIPAKSMVRFQSLPIVLSRYRYSGQPKGKIEWEIGYLEKNQKIGTISMKLPKR